MPIVQPIFVHVIKMYFGDILKMVYTQISCELPNQQNKDFQIFIFTAYFDVYIHQMHPIILVCL